MGCAASTPSETPRLSKIKIAPASSGSTPGQYSALKVKVLEAIKRKDQILLEKILQHHHNKLNQLGINFDPKGSIFHLLAENNFASGMSLLIEYLLQKGPNSILQAINTLNLEGNTPAMICCLKDSPETLDTILKYEVLNLDIKNTEGKTVSDLAMSHSNSCLGLLSSSSTTNAKGTPKHGPMSTELHGSPNRRRGSNLSGKKLIHTFDDLNTKEAESPLTSVNMLTKGLQLRFNSKTKVFGIMKKLKENDTNFVDEDFEHELYSIDENIVQTFANRLDGLSWLRPFEFLDSTNKKIVIFEEIDLPDVSKSNLAGCDLYSALGAMTEFPQRLLNAFTTKEINKQGIYSVNFLIAGIPVEILLDDFFPCYENQLIYSKPVTNELWFPLLEKAFAKLYGSYNAIRDVSISEALEMITGMPSSQHSIKEFNKYDLWYLMQDCDSKNYIISLGTHEREDNTENAAKNRIYTIVNLYEHNEFKILKLRDHFRDFEWDGIFSPSSKNWTKELKDEVGYIKGEKESIYMELDEAAQYFDFLSICHYQEMWKKSRIEAVATHKKPVLFELVLEDETEIFISVHQKLPHYIQDSPDYDISPVEVMVIEALEDNTYKKIATGEKDAFIGKQTVFASENIRMKLTEGKYLIRVKIRWVDQKEHEFSLCTMSSQEVELSQVKIEAYPNILEKVYLNLGLNIRERYRFSNGCEFISGWCGPHMFLYALNKGNKTWNLSIHFETLTNLKLSKKRKKGDSIIKMSVSAKQHQVAYIKRTNSQRVEVQWKLSHSWE